MSRTADYTIQGFLYQFNKTLLEVLKSADDAEITVEGIIEDIEISVPAGLTAIQCKYHEAQEAFTTSTIYKPLLQMMQHFDANQDANISYVLFAHFPNPPGSYSITKTDLEAALASSNDTLKKICTALKDKVDIDNFLTRFSLQFGQSWDDIVKSVHDALITAGIPKADVDTLAYPNAIQFIANLSIKHDVSQRRITKSLLLRDLSKIKSTAITRWTLALKTKKQLFEARRKQLKPNLDKNARLRYFIVNCTSFEDFDNNIVGFVCDYLQKYHFKEAHICTPLLCLDTTEEIFRDIQYRLYSKGIHSTDGYVGSQFIETYFFRPPMFQKGRGVGERKREFDLRILCWAGNGQVLAKQKGDDLFIIGQNYYSDLNTKDVCVEVLESSSLKEIGFITGLYHTYE